MENNNEYECWASCCVSGTPNSKRLVNVWMATVHTCRLWRVPEDPVFMGVELHALCSLLPTPHAGNTTSTVFSLGHDEQGQRPDVGGRVKALEPQPVGGDGEKRRLLQQVVSCVPWSVKGATWRLVASTGCWFVAVLGRCWLLHHLVDAALALINGTCDMQRKLSSCTMVLSSTSYVHCDGRVPPKRSDRCRVF